MGGGSLHTCSLGSMSHRLRRILCRVDDMESSSCMFLNHARDGIPRGFLTKSEVCAERERVSIHDLGLIGVHLLKVFGSVLPFCRFCQPNAQISQSKLSTHGHSEISRLSQKLSHIFSSWTFVNCPLPDQKLCRWNWFSKAGTLCQKVTFRGYGVRSK